MLNSFTKDLFRLHINIYVSSKPKELENCSISATDKYRDLLVQG